MIVTIDGPAGAGKSTIAKLLAQKLGFFYVDTGAMYRAVTLKAIRNKIDLSNQEELIKLAGSSIITFKKDNSGKTLVFIDGVDVSREIRDPEVTSAVFNIAGIPEIRSIMVSSQRQYADANNIVMEGRDIGTIVFPKAEKKFYLDATAKVRARRRLLELRKTGVKSTLKEMITQIEDRDHKDMTRSCGPLKIADDAIYVDTSKLTIKQVIELLSVRIKENEKEK